MWELIGKDNGLTLVYTNTLTWELIGTVIHLRGNSIGTDGRRTTTTTHFKSFQSIEAVGFA